MDPTNFNALGKTYKELVLERLKKDIVARFSGFNCTVDELVAYNGCKGSEGVHINLYKNGNIKVTIGR